MRNLSLASERRRHVPLVDVMDGTGEQGRHIVDMCQVANDCPPIDTASSSSSRFILTNDGILTEVTDQGRKTVWVCHLNQVCGKPSESWFSLAFVDTEELVCLSHNGAIVRVSPSTGRAELVGEFDHGLEAGCWSPDGEVLILLTFAEADGDDHKTTPDSSSAGDGNNQNTTTEATYKSVLLLMNTQWDVLAETTIDRHVPSRPDANNTNTNDASVSIAWRPDGSLCAISTLDQADNTRKVRIYERESLRFHAIGRTEDSSGRLAPNLVGSAGLAWAGPGCSQLLASAQTKGKKTIQIAFFEPNGLRHREFVLREEPATRVLGLVWNVDATILAVMLREPAVGGCDKVQLWHRSNYHWYMKQEFRYYIYHIGHVSFHDENPNLMHVFFQGNLHWREYEFRWETSSVQTTNEQCIAHVIDGCTLNSTGLHKTLVPPPMYATSLTMNSPIRQIATFVDESHQIIAVVYLSDGSFALVGREVVGGDENKSRPEIPKVLANGSFSRLGDIDLSSLRSLVVVDNKPSVVRLLAVICAPTNSSSEQLAVLTISWDDSNLLAEVVVNDTIPLDQGVMAVVQWADCPKGALLEMEDGLLFEFEFTEDGSGKLSPSEVQHLLEPCPWICGFKNMAAFHDSDSDNQLHGTKHQRLILGMSSRARLYYHDLLLADGVSSFFVSIYHQFLCYSHAAGSISQLRFLPLSELHNFDPLMGSDENTLLEGYEPRNVERGARLVALLPGSPTAILQVPRGNLEGVYPRALVLRYVMKQIFDAKYGEAFCVMRRQKVNLNLMVDLNPRKFLQEDCPPFLEQVVVIDHLNLFISCLQNWDSTQNQYIIPPWFHLESQSDAAAKRQFDFSTKVNQVCAEMRRLMLASEKAGHLEGGRKVSDGHFLLPILSTFAKENPPKLESALALIKESAVANIPTRGSGSKKPPLFSERAQSSIQYLAFLADYEILFETALRMYDFDMARAVARNSQMDPKVYLPLLKRYRSLPTYYGRFEVDMRLKRYGVALRSLFLSGIAHKESLEGISLTFREDGVSGNSFDSMLALIEKHELHRVGLELFENDVERRRLIKLSLGEHLLGERKAAAALSVFLAVEPINLDLAKKAARMCNDWKCFFSLALNETEGQDESLAIAARAVAEEIAGTASGQHSQRHMLDDAARILLDYCGDADAAVDMLIKGSSWSEGCRIAAYHRRIDLKQKCIEAAVDFAEMTTSDLQERETTFLPAFKRYEEVLEMRKQAIRNGEAPCMGNALDDETGSLFSTASNASNMSLQSNVSTGSISSVISAKSASSFSISGREYETRHKSKYNEAGGKKKKKRKDKSKKTGRRKIIPGSEEELKEIVETLQANCVDGALGSVIFETITFLVQLGGKVEEGRALFDRYVSVCDAIQQSQNNQKEKALIAKSTGGHHTRSGGFGLELVTHPMEEKVNAIVCPKIPDSLSELMTLLV